MALFPSSPLHSTGMEFIQPLVPVLHADWPSSVLLKSTTTVLNIDDNKK